MTEERYGVRVWIAYAIVSTVWGSTYLAIRVGVLEMPPFWMAGARLCIAGVILLLVALAAGRRLPADAATWGWLLLTGILILGVALGGMFWAEQHLESGLAALLACTSPLLMALYGAVGARGDRLSLRIKLCVVRARSTPERRSALLQRETLREFFIYCDGRSFTCSNCFQDNTRPGNCIPP